MQVRASAELVTNLAIVTKALVTRSRGDAEHLSSSRIRRDNAIIALEAFLPQFCSLRRSVTSRRLTSSREYWRLLKKNGRRKERRSPPKRRRSTRRSTSSTAPSATYRHHRRPRAAAPLETPLRASPPHPQLCTNIDINNSLRNHKNPANCAASAAGAVSPIAARSAWRPSALTVDRSRSDASSFSRTSASGR